MCANGCEKMGFAPEAMTSVAARETEKANDVTVNDNNVVEALAA